MENTYYDKVQILQTFRQAAKEGVLLTIHLGGQGKLSYGTRLIPFAEEKSNETSGVNHATDCLLIAPLEPTDGNIKIRKAHQINLQFYLGLRQFKTTALFQKIIPIAGGQAIQLSLPNLLRYDQRRDQRRVDIPQELALMAKVQKRGEKAVTADVVDLSPGGLSFSIPTQQKNWLFSKGDKVNVSISGKVLLGTPITTFGNVTYIATARDSGNIQLTKQQYGVQFQMLSVANAMAVDKLVKRFE
ncbi:MAG: PilZ domain-containing protein [Magnetococcales bacterium]|nr:PilZ domain-containing protein [Magnetococcales bacterium]